MFFFIHKHIKNEKLENEHCISDVQLVDILTNVLKCERFNSIRELIGVIKCYKAFDLKRGVR